MLAIAARVQMLLLHIQQQALQVCLLSPLQIEVGMAVDIIEKEIGPQFLVLQCQRKELFGEKQYESLYSPEAFPGMHLPGCNEKNTACL